MRQLPPAGSQRPAASWLLSRLPVVAGKGLVSALRPAPRGRQAAAAGQAGSVPAARAGAGPLVLSARVTTAWAPGRPLIVVSGWRPRWRVFSRPLNSRNVRH